MLTKTTSHTHGFRVNVSQTPQGTVAHIFDMQGNHAGVGIAKLRAGDKRDAVTGLNIALGRAMVDYGIRLIDEAMRRDAALSE